MRISKIGWFSKAAPRSRKSSDSSIASQRASTWSLIGDFSASAQGWKIPTRYSAQTLNRTASINRSTQRRRHTFRENSFVPITQQQFPHTPHVIRDPRFHRGRDTERTVDRAEV